MKVGSIKSRWQYLSRKALRWNRIDRDTKNVTAKVVLAEDEGRNKFQGSPPEKHVIVESPQSPSKPQTSPVIAQVIFLVTKCSFINFYF